jgi:hypothetical protein
MEIPLHALIEFDEETREFWTADNLDHYDLMFEKDDQFILLCHLYQMPGHCMVIRLADKKIYGPLHTEDFDVVPFEEHTVSYNDGTDSYQIHSIEERRDQ